MKPFKYLVLALLIACNYACSSDDDDENLTKDGPFAISELSGEWESTSAIFNGDAMWVDVVDDGGSVTMSVQSNGNFTITIHPINRNAYTVSGEMFWEEWQGNFYFAILWDDYPDDWDTYGHSYDGDTFSFNGAAATGEYDFDNDGIFEPCSISVTFVRL